MACKFCAKSFDFKIIRGDFCSASCKAKYANTFKIRKECPKCKQEITKSNFERHVKACEGVVKKQKKKENSIKIQEEWKQPNGKYKCPDCNKEFTKAGIGSHIWRMHTEEGRKFEVTPSKPNSETRRKQGWSRGLTKETDERVRKCGENNSLGYKIGRNKPTFKGKKHTLETLDQMSKSRMQHLEKKSGWAGTHYRYASVKAGQCTCILLGSLKQRRLWMLLVFIGLGHVIGLSIKTSKDKQEDTGLIFIYPS